MKQTISANQAAHRLASPERGFTYAGALALCEYFEELENDTGEEMEFDIVAIRCDWSEYGSALEAATEYGFESDSDDFDKAEEAALDWLRDQTAIVKFDGGVVIQSF